MIVEYISVDLYSITFHCEGGKDYRYYSEIDDFKIAVPPCYFGKYDVKKFRYDFTIRPGKYRGVVSIIDGEIFVNVYAGYSREIYYIVKKETKNKMLINECKEAYQEYITENTKKKFEEEFEKFVRENFPLGIKRGHTHISYGEEYLKQHLGKYGLKDDVLYDFCKRNGIVLKKEGSRYIFSGWAD
jgi:hypothetical protein